MPTTARERNESRTRASNAWSPKSCPLLRRTSETNVVSSVSGKNDYKPTPYEEGSKKYKRALSKLDGTFTGRDLNVSYADKKDPTEPTEATTPEEITP